MIAFIVSVISSIQLAASGGRGQVAPDQIRNSRSVESLDADWDEDCNTCSLCFGLLVEKSLAKEEDQFLDECLEESFYNSSVDQSDCVLIDLCCLDVPFIAAPQGVVRHVFHATCLITELCKKKAASCPTCKKQFLPEAFGIEEMNGKFF